MTRDTDKQESRATPVYVMKLTRPMSFEDFLKFIELRNNHIKEYGERIV